MLMNLFFSADDTSESKQTHAGVIDVPATAVRPSGSTTPAATSPLIQVRSVPGAVAHNQAAQVLETRLRDWMANNSPASSRDTWRKPFSASGAPRVSQLRRAATDVYTQTVLMFYCIFCFNAKVYV